jgi:hypothetical protein
MKLYKFAIAELILKFGPFAFLFYFANVGTPGEFGEIAKLVVFFEAIYILFSFSVPSIIKIKYFKLTTVSFREYLDQLRSLIFLAFFCLGVVCAFYSFLLLTICLAALSRTIGMMILALYQCMQDEDEYFKLSLCTLATYPVAFAFHNFLENLVASWIVSMFLPGMIIAIVSFNKHDITRYRFNLQPRNILPLISFGLSFTPAALAWWIKNAGERAAVEQMIGMSALGSYGFILQVTSIILVTSQVSNLINLPRINVAIENREIVRTLFLLKKQFLTIGSIFILMMISFDMLADLDIFRKYKVSELQYYTANMSALVHAGLFLIISPLYYFGDINRVSISLIVAFTAQYCIVHLINMYSNVTLSDVYLISFGTNSLIFIFLAARLYRNIKRQE